MAVFIPIDDPHDDRAAGFQPKEIQLLRAIIDDAAAMVPEALRPADFEERLVRRILADASGRIKSPINLEMIALLALAEVMKAPMAR
jgi:hypothetical protein